MISRNDSVVITFIALAQIVLVLTPREIKRRKENETRVQNITEIVEREICSGSGHEGRRGITVLIRGLQLILIPRALQ